MAASGQKPIKQKWFRAEAQRELALSALGLPAPFLWFWQLPFSQLYSLLLRLSLQRKLIGNLAFLVHLVALVQRNPQF